MRVRTVLNQLVDFKGFVLVKEHIIEREDGLELEILVRPRANSRALCSGCNTLTSDNYSFPPTTIRKSVRSC